jgi:hypothetical protein
MNSHFIIGSAERISFLLIHPLMISFAHSQELKYSTSSEIPSQSLLMSLLKRVPFSSISICVSSSLNMVSALIKRNTSAILYWILGSRTPKKESKDSILHGQQIEQPKKKSPKSFQLVLKNLKPSNMNLEARMHVSMANICTSRFGLVPT